MAQYLPYFRVVFPGCRITIELLAHVAWWIFAAYQVTTKGHSSMNSQKKHTISCRITCVHNIKPQHDQNKISNMIKTQSQTTWSHEQITSIDQPSAIMWLLDASSTWSAPWPIHHDIPWRCHLGQPSSDKRLWDRCHRQGHGDQDLWNSLDGGWLFNGY